VAHRTGPNRQNLSANERALLDSIRRPVPRSLFAGVWNVKLRLRPRERRPERNDDLGIFDLMRVRRSCRSFQTRKLTAADHDELLRYVRLHSEAPGIGRSAVRFEYLSAPLTVWLTVNASEFLVAVAPREYDRLAVIDVGRSLQEIVMDATRMDWGHAGSDRVQITRASCGIWGTASIPGEIPSSACGPSDTDRGSCPCFCASSMPGSTDDCRSPHSSSPIGSSRNR
jgi:hypothetical protein